METTAGMIVSVAAIASNLLIGAMFLARVDRPAVAPVLGWTGTAMAVPLAFASVLFGAAGADPWDVALPLVFVAFAVVEVAVDGVLKIDVRRPPFLGPYLALFYLGQWSLIGAALRFDPPAGAAVLVTYFLCLAATAYSVRRVGHGAPTVSTSR